MQLTGCHNGNEMRNATCVATKTSKIPTQVNLLLFPILWHCPWVTWYWSWPTFLFCLRVPPATLANLKHEPYILVGGKPNIPKHFSFRMWQYFLHTTDLPQTISGLTQGMIKNNNRWNIYFKKNHDEGKIKSDFRTPAVKGTSRKILAQIYIAFLVQNSKLTKPVHVS